MKDTDFGRVVHEIRIIDHLSLITWKRQLRAILLTKDAWKVINGELSKPISNDPTDKTFRRNMEKWCKLNNIALGWMLLTLEDYSKQSVEKFIDPMDVMGYLFRKFTPPFMSWEEFVGREVPRTLEEPTVVVQGIDEVLSSPNSPSRGERVGRIERTASPRLEPRDEIHRQASQNPANLAPNGAGGLEAPPRSPRHLPLPFSPLRPTSPPISFKHARNPSGKSSASEENKLTTPIGIHNIISRKDLHRGTMQSSNNSGSSTIRRNRFVTKIIGSKPSSPDPGEDRMSLTIHRADFAARNESSEYGAATSGDEPSPNNMPPRHAAIGDKEKVPPIPDRNVSLRHSEEGHDRNHCSRTRSRARSRVPQPKEISPPPPVPRPRQRSGSRPKPPPRTHGRGRQPPLRIAVSPKATLEDDGLYMMSGALQDPENPWVNTCRSISGERHNGLELLESTSRR